MKQAWYGPLVQLQDVSANVGGHVQLVVFILQCHPAETVKTSKGNEATRCILYVSDSSCSRTKVSLWNKCASSQNVSAGDIVFLQNLRVAQFNGQIELTSVQSSNMVVLLKRQDILSQEGLEHIPVTCQHGPLVNEKIKVVVSWVCKTQKNLISLLNHISAAVNHKVISRGPEQIDSGFLRAKISRTAKYDEVKSCSSILEIARIQDCCVIEFFATVREIFIPCLTSDMNWSLSRDGCLLFSQYIYGRSAKTLLNELLCIGCENCGIPLDMDRNGISGRCRCEPIYAQNTSGAQTMKRTRTCNIFRPFLLYVGDESAQTSVLVRHKAAKKLFGDISVDNVFQSVHQNIKGTGDDEYKTSFPNQSSIDYGMILLLLIRSLISSNNSQMRFKVACDPSMVGTIEHLDLLHVCLPVLKFPAKS